MDKECGNCGNGERSVLPWARYLINCGVSFVRYASGNLEPKLMRDTETCEKWKCPFGCGEDEVD